MNPEDKYYIELPSSVYVARKAAPEIKRISEQQRMANLLNLTDKNKTYIGDRDKATHYANMQGMVNHNLFGYGASPAHIDYDPTTPYGLAMILGSIDYMHENPSAAIVPSAIGLTRGLMVAKTPTTTLPTLSETYEGPALFNYLMTGPELGMLLPLVVSPFNLEKKLINKDK